MKVTAFIRQATVKGTPNETVHIYFRVRDGKTDIKAASELSSILTIGTQRSKATSHAYHS